MATINAEPGKECLLAARITKCERALHLAFKALETMEEQDIRTHQLVQSVQSTIINHVLDARNAHVRLDSHVVDILNKAVNRADMLLVQDLARKRQEERWRERVVACAMLHNQLACQPLREMMEVRLPQELCDVIYEQVAKAGSQTAASLQQ